MVKVLISSKGKRGCHCQGHSSPCASRPMSTLGTFILPPVLLWEPK